MTCFDLLTLPYNYQTTVWFAYAFFRKILHVERLSTVMGGHFGSIRTEGGAAAPGVYSGGGVGEEGDRFTIIARVDSVHLTARWPM